MAHLNDIQYSLARIADNQLVAKQNKDNLKIRVNIELHLIVFAFQLVLQGGTPFFVVLGPAP